MSNTLRLLMPRWQGGNNLPYTFGARLLDFLAPDTGVMPRAEVPIGPYEGEPLPLEDGIAGRSAFFLAVMPIFVM